MPEFAASFRCTQFACALLLWLVAGAFPAALASTAEAEPSAKVGAANSILPGEIQLHRTRFTVAARQVTVDYQLGLKGLNLIRDPLREGAHMAVEGGIRLLQRNLLRPNSELAFQPLAWILRHDPLTREFLIADASTAKAGQVSRSPHLDTLLREAWSDLHAVLTPETPFADGETYIVQFDLVLKYAEVPPWLKKALQFFWSWELSPKFSHEHAFIWRGD